MLTDVLVFARMKDGAKRQYRVSESESEQEAVKEVIRQTDAIVAMALVKVTEIKEVA